MTAATATPIAPGPTPSIIRELLARADQPGLLSLAGGLPATELLPRRSIAEAAATVLEGTGHALQYAPTEGIEPLRALLADRGLGSAGRVGQVLVTSGSQQALDLLARTLGPGATVALDDPCYLGARQAFDRPGVRLVGVPVDGDGLRTDVLGDLLAGGLRPRLVYTVASHHNPTGVDLAPARRRHLIELAERFGFLVVDDGAYRGLSFDGTVPPVLARTSDHVLSIGTVSKTIAPGLRVGWALGPSAVIARLALEKQAVDLQTSTFGQHLVLSLLERDGWIEARLQRLRPVYRERCRALLGALGERFGDRVEVSAPSGGLFLWARLRGADTEALLDRALDAGVAFVPGSAFAVDQTGGDRAIDRMRLSFATLSPMDLVTAVDRLATVADQGTGE